MAEKKEPLLTQLIAVFDDGHITVTEYLKSSKWKPLEVELDNFQVGVGSNAKIIRKREPNPSEPYTIKIKKAKEWPGGW